MGFLGDFQAIAAVIFSGVVAVMAFLGGKKLAQGQNAKREAKRQAEILEDVQVVSSIRADDSDDPKQRLRDQSHRDS